MIDKRRDEHHKHDEQKYEQHKAVECAIGTTYPLKIVLGISICRGAPIGHTDYCKQQHCHHEITVGYLIRGDHRW